MIDESAAPRASFLGRLTTEEDRMAVTNVLAVVPTADLAAERPWWAAPVGPDADSVPMPSDVERQLAPSGGIQLVDDAEHAGSASVTLGVDDVDAEPTAIARRGLAGPEARTVPSGRFRTAMLRDPDGSTVVLGQDPTSGGA